MSHTPGPWIVSDERDCETRHFATVICHQLENRGVEIAILRGRTPYRDGEGLDNAHLIAAAPELLDACQMALKAMADARIIGVTILERAIAKAMPQSANAGKAQPTK